MSSWRSHTARPSPASSDRAFRPTLRVRAFANSGYCPRRRCALHIAVGAFAQYDPGRIYVVDGNTVRMAMTTYRVVQRDALSGRGELVLVGRRTDHLIDPSGLELG